MSISFNNIPVDLRTPGQFIEISNARAVKGTPAMPNVALLMGQMLAAGTATAEEPIMVASKEVAETYFGHGSYLAAMVEAFKNVNPYTELWVIPMADEVLGTAATGTFVFSGTATEDGNVYTYIAGHRIVTAVSNGDAAATVGAAVVADITAYVADHNVPVSAAGTTTVTITALHKGTLGNGINIQLNYNAGEALPAGISCVTTAVGSVVAGATDPDITNSIAAMADAWYTTVISALADDTNQDLLEAELLTRWGPMYMRDGHSYIGAVGNQAALTALGNARNHKHSTLMGGGVSPTPAWIWATVAGALDAGEPDPARPRQTLLMTGCKAPKPADQFTQAERAILLTDGVSTFTVGQDGNCYVERLITTYQTNALSVPDPSYLDVCTMRTLAYVRYSLRVRMALRFPRHKLADDGTAFAAGQAIVTPSVVKSEILSLFRQWENEGLVEGFEQFKKDIIVERNANDVNRIDVQLSPDLMNQFRVFAGQVQFLL